MLGTADVAIIFRHIWAVFRLFSLRHWVQDVIRVTQAGEWQKSKQMMGLPSPSLRPLGAFLQFILSRKTECLAHLDCSFGFKQKRHNFWLKETLRPTSTSFELFPLPLSFSTTKTPQFLAGSLVKILDNFVCSWVFAVARGHLGKLMMSTGQMDCMSTDEQGWAMQCLPRWALVSPAPGDSLDPSDRLD